MDTRRMKFERRLRNVITKKKEMKEESKYRRPDGFQSIEDKIRLVASEMKCAIHI